MPITIRGEIVQANQVVLDQVDFFQSDNYTRVTGLIPSSLVSKIFYNNVQQSWPLISGLGIPDAHVTSGYIYFNEIPGNPGFYSIRFRPNAIGFWRNLLSYPAGQQIVAQGFDVIQNASAVGQGLSTSLINPQGGCGC